MASKRVYVELRTYVNDFKRNNDLVLPINLPQFNIQLIFLSRTATIQIFIWYKHRNISASFLLSSFPAT